MVDQIDGSYVTAFGAGLVGGMSGQMVSFTVTAKQGSLSKYQTILVISRNSNLEWILSSSWQEFPRD